MKHAHFLDIVRALNLAAVRYLIVGGIAVNVHGYLRHTKDVDLVIALDEPNCRAAMDALTSLGYAPKIPEAAERFADPSIRRRWIEENHMIVFQMWSDARMETPIDIFVAEPFDFAKEAARARMEIVAPNVRAPIVGLEALLQLKRAASRPQDLADIDRLEKTNRESGSA